MGAAMGAVIVGLATTPVLSAPPTSGSALAQISLQPVGEGRLSIVADVIAFADIAVHAELKVVRRGAGGDVVSNQARAIELDAGERATIARLDVSLALGDEMTATVVVSSGEDIISTAAVSTGDGL